jgi:hypothetical protein
MNSTSLNRSLVDRIFSNTPFDFENANRISAEMPDSPIWVWWSFVIEAVIIVLGGFSAVLCITIMIKYPLFHKNLHFLIGWFKGEILSL